MKYAHKLLCCNSTWQWHYIPCKRKPNIPSLSYRLPVVVNSSWGRCLAVLVRLARFLGPLQLHLESLCADLESVHGLDGCLRWYRVVVTHKACVAKTNPNQMELAKETKTHRAYLYLHLLGFVDWHQLVVWAVFFLQQTSKVCKFWEYIVELMKNVS